MYTRLGIPTVTALKEKITLLEGGEVVLLSHLEWELFLEQCLRF